MVDEIIEWEDVVSLSAAIDQGRVTPSKLLRRTLSRIDELDPALIAFVHVDRDGAEIAATASDKRALEGTRLGPLDGIPIAIKDNIYVRDMPARWGSRLFADHVPSVDDICIERLRAAGAVLVGKTATPEFALMSRTQSPISGVTRNPVDPALTPGGSSGGTVSAIASGMVPLGLGTDAGGSIRNPAGFTGLVGFRPSTARIPRCFGFPPMALDFQVIGLATRTLPDLELLYDVVAGPDPRDPVSFNLPEPETPARPRLGWFNAVGDVECDPAVLASFGQALNALRVSGMDVQECAAPYDLVELSNIWQSLVAAGSARVALENLNVWRSLITEPVRGHIERGLSMKATGYVSVLDQLAAFRASVGQAWPKVDYLVTPTSPAPAWPAEKEHPVAIGGRPGRPGAQDAFLGWVNAMGYPAISVPIRPHEDGRPIGLQIIGRCGTDRQLINLAARLAETEAWSDPAQYPPTISSFAQAGP